MAFIFPIPLFTLVTTTLLEVHGAGDAAIATHGFTVLEKQSSSEVDDSFFKSQDADESSAESAASNRGLPGEKCCLLSIDHSALHSVGLEAVHY